MKTIALAVIGALVLAIIVRKMIIWSKKPLRRVELRMHIADIYDPRGYETASDELFPKALHIVEHYGIELSEVGYKGSIADLKAEAWRSLNRYNLRMEAEAQKLQPKSAR